MQTITTNPNSHKYWFVLLVVTSLFFGSCNHQYVMADQKAQYYKEALSNEQPKDEIETLISPFRKQMDSTMGTVIYKNDILLEKKRPEATLGRWFCDIIYAAANEMSEEPIDFVIQNHGGIRIPSISPGDVTIGKIYELMPFDNQLVFMKLTGVEVEELIRHTISLGGWPVSQSLNINKHGNSLKIKIKGEELSQTKIYYIGLPDYVANGGDRTAFLVDKPRVVPKKLLRSIAIDYLMMHPDFKVKEEDLKGRVIIQ